jgi:uncharacterized membrane protein (UPF0127 family)
MTVLRLLNLTHPVDPALRVRYCDTFWSRFRGLMLAPPVELHGGILMDEKSDSRVNTSIHMFFMRFDIAVIWINSEMTVVDSAIARRWAPYYAPALPARYILETHPERIHDFKPGDRVKLQDE